MGAYFFQLGDRGGAVIDLGLGERRSLHDGMCLAEHLAVSSRRRKNLSECLRGAQFGMVALGGGVVGYLAGFVAATYLRGIAFIQVPTTLLAQVDSSVGGKVGVNLKSGKNLVGAFYQPRLVLCDLDTLKTLQEREYRSGLAEVIKYGIIYDAQLFGELERVLPQLLERDAETLARVVARCCAIRTLP